MYIDLKLLGTFAGIYIVFSKVNFCVSRPSSEEPTMLVFAAKLLLLTVMAIDGLAADVIMIPPPRAIGKDPFLCSRVI